MTVRKRVIVSGHVQGVFFRDTCRRVAEKHGVNGSARNTADGTVELVLEGPSEAVDAVVDWARSGPKNASVTSVQTSDEDPEGLTGFRTA